MPQRPRERRRQKRRAAKKLKKWRRKTAIARLVVACTEYIRARLREPSLSERLFPTVEQLEKEEREVASWTLRKRRRIHRAVRRYKRKCYRTKRVLPVVNRFVELAQEDDKIRWMFPKEA